MNGYALPLIDPLEHRLGDDVTVREHPRHRDAAGEQGVVVGWNVLLSGRRIYQVQLTTGERIDCFSGDLEAVAA